MSKLLPRRQRWMSYTKCEPEATNSYPCTSANTQARYDIFLRVDFYTNGIGQPYQVKLTHLCMVRVGSNISQNYAHVTQNHSSFQGNLSRYLRVWRGVVFLIRHSSIILVTGVELSVSCCLLDTRYISLYDTSYHRKEFYLTAYYRAAQPYQLYIRPMTRILNILYYHDSGVDSTKSHARCDWNSRI